MMDIQKLLKELMMAAYDTGYYSSEGEDEKDMQYRKALARRMAAKQLIEAEFDRLNNKTETSLHLQKSAPRVEIVLAIDVDSYLLRYREQEGEPNALTEQLKRDVLRALSEVRFDVLAQEIILRQESTNLGLSVPIKDPYQGNTAEETAECEE